VIVGAAGLAAGACRNFGMGGWGMVNGMDRIEVMIWLVFSFSDVCLCLDVERKVPVLQ
jgi:hypothetical protein